MPPFETNWMTGVCHANGIDIHYLRTGGPKPPLVLLHGLTGSGACFTPLARALEGEYDVLMPDARGHGNSSSPPRGYRYEDHASDVVGLIRGLGLSAPTLLGHSMGGTTAAVVASQLGAAARALILADPTFLSAERQREVQGSDVVEQHRRLLGLDRASVVAEIRARHAHRSSEIVELLAEARLRTRIAAFEVLTPPNPEYQQLASTLSVPTLLVVGDSAPALSLETAGQLASLNPLLRIEQIKNAGHGLMYDQPERFEAVVRSFLRSVAAMNLPEETEKPVLDAQQRHWQATFAARPEMFGREASEPARRSTNEFERAGLRRVLELGGGQGRDSLFFAAEGFEVHVLEYARAGVDAIRRKAAEAGIGARLSASQHDVRVALPFPDASFDACFSHMLLCMAFTTAELVAVMAEVHRVLPPGGLVVYTVRHTGDADYRQGIHRGEDLYESQGFIVHFFDRAKVDLLARGFEIVSVEEFEEGKLPRRLYRVTMRRP